MRGGRGYARLGVESVDEIDFAFGRVSRYTKSTRIVELGELLCERTSHLRRGTQSCERAIGHEGERADGSHGQARFMSWS